MFASPMPMPPTTTTFASITARFRGRPTRANEGRTRAGTGAASFEPPSSSASAKRVAELRAALEGVLGSDEVRAMRKPELRKAYEALISRKGVEMENTEGIGGAERVEAEAKAEASSSSMRKPRTVMSSKVFDAVGVSSEEMEREVKSNFSGTELTFLGTSSGAPSFTRNVSSVALRLENEVWLFDCGEATQHQLMRSKLKYAKITKVFITHMHGDHIFGLPGLICAISGARTAYAKAHPTMGKTVQPLHIIGPPGIRQYIYSSITYSRSVLGMPLIVTELRHTARAGTPGPHVSVDPRGKIFMGEYWPDNASEPVPAFKDAGSWAKLGADGQMPVWTAFNDGTFCVRATVLRHPVPCFGYIIDEADAAGRLDPEKCRELGLPPGKEYSMLKDGHAVTGKDGRVIRPEDVIGAARPGRRLVHLGDTCDSSAIVALAQGADTLVHESTFSSDKYHEALFKGHSTARMAGDFARQVHARSLILTHFSNRYAGGVNRANSDSDDLGVDVDDGEDDTEDMAPPDGSEGENIELHHMHVDRLVEEAAEAKGDSRVIAASDFFVFNIARRETFDDFDRCKGNREHLFEGEQRTLPDTVIADDSGLDGGRSRHTDRSAARSTSRTRRPVAGRAHARDEKY
ncbi:beta-lactamase-like protein [Ostreococcus tauri]|uniref:Beta-lactamase-like protein n=1 Tax=Ostreococcus tauri TaxID=70448 RepID=A0A1Y5I0B3_OSTTA|nr:beta-lactamase-like protein [Ostreococcus tauri]